MFSSLCSFGESFQHDEGADEPMRSVYVNVYDMRPENNWGFHLGIGVWHTGVQLFNSIEVTFGGHPGSFSGVFSLPPKSVPLPLRHSIKIGTLNKSPAELRAILEQISEEYPGNSYNILNRNCNHFSDDLCRRLVGKGIPPYINRLAGIASLVKCWLPDSIRDAAPTDPELMTDDEGAGSFGSCTCSHHGADSASSPVSSSFPSSSTPQPFTGPGRRAGPSPASSSRPEPSPEPDQLLLCDDD